MNQNSDITWLYDEYEQVGTDYGKQSEVDVYDARHGDFRDTEAESARILDALEIKESDSLIDFGAGTGVFAIRAAQSCSRVYAVDVSQPMLDRVRNRAVEAGLSNIEFHNAGFLTYAHEDAPVDAVVTTFAFHHLPDFWKGIALTRIHGMLKPGGSLYIRDVIMEEAGAMANIQALIERLGSIGGDPLREDTERHFQDEYSTYDWVMDGLLSRSGFSIRSKDIEEGVIGTYICTRESEGG